MENQSEEQGAKRVALLNTSLRRNDERAEHKFRRRGVAKLNPGGKAGKAVSHLGDEGLPADGVERVREIEFQEHFVNSVAVALTPLLGHLQPDLGSQGERDADLQWAEVLTGRVLRRLAEELGLEATERFADGDGAGRPILFRKGHEESTAKPRLHVRGGLALAEEVG